jgi:uncharacterized protein YggU (UPF0235/DUF167 family)
MTGFAKSIWRPERGGVLVRVRVTPRGGRDAVEDVTETAQGPALAVRVRAVPEDGAANAGVEAALADWLGCARGEVSVAAGHKSRVKTIAIVGHAGELGARLSSLIAELEVVGAKR